MAAPTIPSPLGRFAEIDLVRGVAVLLMIAYHVLFDLNFFSGATYELNTGLFWAIGRAAAVLFVGLAGLSMALAWKRKHSGNGFAFITRGLFLLGLGFLLTVFTRMVFPAYMIWFGVLHLIGAGLILGIVFLKRPKLAAIAGILFTLLGIIFSMPGIQENIPQMVPIFPIAMNTFDYFPILPWFGVFLLGMSVGHYFYPSGKQRHRVHIDVKNPIVNLLVRAGKKSLLIYFLHQPIIVGILYLFAR